MRTWFHLSLQAPLSRFNHANFEGQSPYGLVDWASKEGYQAARCYPLASQDYIRWKEEVVRGSKRKEPETPLQNCEVQWLIKQIWVRRLEETRKRAVKSHN